MYKLGLVYFAPEEGRTLEVRRSHAQGEIANIPLLVQNYDNQDRNAIVTLTTPCLTAACSMARKKPVVFTYVYDPIAAGAGNSRTDHLPRITGVGSFPPVNDTIDV